MYGNNSGKPEPIGTKLYTEASVQVAGSLAKKCKHLVPSAAAKREQNGDENPHLANFSVTETTHRFTLFPAADFLEI